MSDKPALTVLLASPRGFCAGVDRAIQIVEQALARYGAPVYVRHEIVHNKHVVDSLKAKGAVFVEELAEIPDGANVIFSAHGVAKAVVQDAKDRGLAALDATCPLVSKVHSEAARHHFQGRHVLLIGHEGHPEVVGTMGQVPPGAMTLIQSAADAEAVQPADPANLAYATQTTLSVGDTAEIVATLQRRFPAIKGPGKADICYATTNRQEAVKAIAPRVDAILVVGAPNSSNSQRLKELAAQLGCKVSLLVQTAAEIPWEQLEGVKALGVTAGASAPEILVQDVIRALQKRYDVTLEEASVTREDVIFSLPKALAG
ncbi:MAG TPA: 4-hydroxy-3-methylbut-2-enyl diphosphate reductase [Alphaproteobacteria bacterium]|nr:4-hydroxy-3-methylbut-2-enyl diphosphate reductase [Alphaproteobacteria bacterium]